MTGETTITLVGNLTSDPELRFTPTGTPVAKFTLASTPRFFNKASGNYEDGETVFMPCNVWREAAENATESLSKGIRVIVNGRLKARSFDAKDGTKRTVFEIEVDSFGPDLTRATAVLTKNTNKNSQNSNATSSFEDIPF